jgi:hypothetical protein
MHVDLASCPNLHTTRFESTKLQMSINYEILLLSVIISLIVHVYVEVFTNRVLGNILRPKRDKVTGE